MKALKLKRRKHRPRRERPARQRETGGDLCLLTCDFRLEERVIAERNDYFNSGSTSQEKRASRTESRTSQPSSIVRSLTEARQPLRRSSSVGSSVKDLFSRRIHQA